MSQLPPAGWHPDPVGRNAQRYWDGQQWTEHVADQAGNMSTDPLDGGNGAQQANSQAQQGQQQQQATEQSGGAADSSQSWGSGSWGTTDADQSDTTQATSNAASSSWAAEAEGGQAHQATSDEASWGGDTSPGDTSPGDTAGTDADVADADVADTDQAGRSWGDNLDDTDDVADDASTTTAAWADQAEATADTSADASPSWGDTEADQASPTADTSWGDTATSDVDTADSAAPTETTADEPSSWTGGDDALAASGAVGAAAGAGALAGAGTTTADDTDEPGTTIPATPDDEADQVDTGDAIELAEVDGTAVWTAGVVAIEVDDSDAVIAARDAVVARQSTVTAGSGEHGSRLSGAGTVWIGGGGRALTVMTLEQPGLTVRSDNLVAHSASLSREDAHAGIVGFDGVRLTGAGWVALAAHGGVVELATDGGVDIAATALVAFTNDLDVSHAEDVAVSGHGIALVSGGR